MLTHFGTVLYFLARRFYSKLNIPEDVQLRLKNVPEDGEMVYIMRNRNVVDYLVINHVLKRHNLPLAGFANGIDLTFFRSFSKWLTRIWNRMFSPLPESPLSPVEQFEATLDAKKPALLFMRARTLASERHTSPEFFLSLVRRQREQERSIFLVPQYISLSRKPRSKRLSWFDIAFGDPESAGFLRKLAHVLFSSRRTSLRIADPSNLKEMIERNEGLTDERVATKLRRVLRVHLAREAMTVTGPRVKPSHMLRREILERKAFNQELETICEEEGLSKFESKQKAKRYLKEIAASLNFEVVEGFIRFLNFVFNKIYSGIELNKGGVERVREAAKQSRSAPLILVPSHKSHIDYLVISWVFTRRDFISPHIAAGANLSFFPLGLLFRHSGAFFLRRSFKGLSIYKLVFQHYLWKLAREGYPIEFFIEGGRSRTGKLLPPKMGILSMLMEGWRRGEYQDLQFIPVNLSYERVLETGSYRSEQSGAKKESESVGGIVRASSVLRSRYGRVYVSFEEPIRLSEYMQKLGFPEAESLEKPSVRNVTEKLGYKIMRSIQEATVIAPSTLVGTVLLSHERRGISESRLKETAGFLVSLLVRRGIRLSASIQHRLDRHSDLLQKAHLRGAHEYAVAIGDVLGELLDDGLLLIRRLLTVVEGPSDNIIVVPDKNRLEIDNYRNALLSTIAPDCIIATALLVMRGPVSYDDLAEECRKLSYWLRYEFIYQTDRTYNENFEASLNSLIEDGVIALADGFVQIRAPKTLNFYRATLRHLLEGYWLTADALRSLSKGSVEKKSWIKLTSTHGERQLLQGFIKRPESISTIVIQNALMLFENENLVSVRKINHSNKSSLFLTLSSTSTLEELALRRDELGVYLSDPASQSDTSPPLAFTPEALNQDSETEKL